MNKILVTLFTDEDSAYKGLDALHELHGHGDITLYGSSMIAKQADGTAKKLELEDPGPIGAVVGLVGGSMLGLLGGPVGAAIGATVGATTGMLYDLISVGIGADFVDDVSSAMEPGMVAVIADIDEGRITPVESQMAALGGQTIRRVPSNMLEEQLNHDIDAMSAELAQLNVELRDATSKADNAITKRIDADAAKIEDIKKRADKEIAKAQANYEARVTTLRAQRERALEQRKTAIDGRIAELKADYDLRRGKLERAHDLSKQALELRRQALSPAH